MKIGGFQKFSLIDYPGKISCIIFTQGCNFRCFYCHNPELVYPHLFGTPLAEEEIMDFLKRRKKQLEAIVISGGEPTIQEDLVPFLKMVKTLGYAVKLDTNGSNPLVIRELVRRKLVDYIAMDIKAPLKKYQDLVKVKMNLSRIKESIEIIENSSVEYEFRTTYIPSFLTSKDLLEILSLIKNKSRFTVQEFVFRKEKEMNWHILS